MRIIYTEPLKEMTIYRFRSAIALFAVTLATTFVAHPAIAGDGATLVQEAGNLLAEGKVSEACAKLDQSLAAEPRSSTALALASCRKGEGRLGAASRAYAAAEKLAQKERKNDQLAKARAGVKEVSGKIARLTVEVADDARVEGLTVSVDGLTVPDDRWGQPWEVDAGEPEVVASAPGHQSWQKKVSVGAGAKASVVIPALAEAPAEPAPAATEVEEQEPAPAAEQEEEPAEDDDDAREHEAGRLVVELGPFGGLLVHAIDRGDLRELDGSSYTYRSSPSSFTVAACGDTETVPGAGECEASLEGSVGALVGGQLFVGWAVHERVHLGGRGFLAARFPDGFYLVGGPSISARVAGPLWLGGTFLLGGSEHTATITGATGSIPAEASDLNDGATTVPVEQQELRASEGNLASGLMLGGAVELSLSLLGPSPHALASTGSAPALLHGALQLGLWPTLLATLDGGLAFALPAGVHYRFH